MLRRIFPKFLVQTSLPWVGRSSGLVALGEMGQQNRNWGFLWGASCIGNTYYKRKEVSRTIIISLQWVSCFHLQQKCNHSEFPSDLKYLCCFSKPGRPVSTCIDLLISVLTETDSNNLCYSFSREVLETKDRQILCSRHYNYIFDSHNYVFTWLSLHGSCFRINGASSWCQGQNMCLRKRLQLLPGRCCRWVRRTKSPELSTVPLKGSCLFI